MNYKPPGLGSCAPAGIERLPEVDFHLGTRQYHAFTHDWRTMPVDEWLAMRADRETSDELAPAPASGPPVAHAATVPPPASPADMPPAPSIPPTPALDEATFGAAVRAALQGFTSPAALAANPFTRTPLVTVRVAPTATAAERGATLRAILLETLAPLGENVRDQRLYNALYHTYVVPAGSQEGAAERADVPFSTFRRHLKEGIERLTAELWAASQAGS